MTRTLADRALLARLDPSLTRTLAAHKYHARAVVVDGLRFPSQLEARRWQTLQLLQRAGQIEGLERQVPLVLHVRQRQIGVLRVDFHYWQDGVEVWEDTKGYEPPLSRWKRKHVQAQYGIALRLVRR